jgi:hypothetical protein
MEKRLLESNTMTLTFTDRYDSLRYAASMSPRGTAVEFGVHSGRTLTMIREHFKGSVIGFDSFNGLPETWRPGFEEGHFATTRIPLVANATIVVGLFEQTVPGVFESLTAPITLVHFDADLYSSTAFALEQVTPYLGERCMFVFDEYVNYPGWEQHEHLAFREWREKYPQFITTSVGRVPSHQQAIFEIVRR